MSASPHLASDTDTPRPRLLLVEDDPILGPTTGRLLEQVYSVTLLTDGAKALADLTVNDYDVLVIDRLLPGLDGLSLIAELRDRRVTTPVLLLTALGSVSDKVRGLDAGANDYLVKPVEIDELLARLRAIRRVFTGEGRSVQFGLWELYPESRTLYSPYDGRIVLTERETSLLQLLAEHPRQTYSRGQLLQGVCGHRPARTRRHLCALRATKDRSGHHPDRPREGLSVGSGLNPPNS